jgi:HEAT repeat protein
MKIIRYLWRKRALVAWILSIAIIIAALLSPEGRLWVKGLWRREPFYRGFPACYWAEQIRQDRPHLVGPVYEIVGRTAHLTEPFWGTDSTAVPVLLSLLKHEDLCCRQFAVKTLTRMASSPQIIPPLIEAAVDSESGISKESASALGIMAHPKDIGVIVKGLLKTGEDQKCLSLFDDFIREHAMAKLSWKADLDIDPLADALEDALQDGDPEVSRRARMVFEMIGPKAAIFARLTKVLRQGDPKARAKAKREFLAASPDQSAIPGLIILLREKDIPMQRNAANAILPLLTRWNYNNDNRSTYRMNFPRAILPSLVELARADNIECRRKAAEAFIRLPEGSIRVVSVLIELLRTNDRTTQDNALRALYRVAWEAEPAIPALLDLMKREPLKGEVSDQNMPDNQPVVFSVIGNRNQTGIGPREVLVAIGSPAAPALIEALKRPERPVRLGAIEALRLIEPPARNALPALLTALHDNDPLIRKEIVYSLGNFAYRTNYDEKAISALSKMLSDKDYQVQESAALALGWQLLGYYSDNLGSHTAVLALIDAARSKDARLRLAAARGLQTMCANLSRFLSAAQQDFNAKNWESQPVQMLVMTLIEVFQWDNSQVRPATDFLAINQRRSAIALLAKVGPEAMLAIPALTEALQDFELYEAASEALSKIKAKEASAGKNR